MKAHIHTKGRQFTEITRIKSNLNKDEFLIHLGYSENYKCQHQNEIQSAYFGKKTSNLFTDCTHYKQNEKIQKLPITVTTQEKHKCRVAPMPCVNKVITLSFNKINQTIQSQMFTMSATDMLLSFVRDLSSFSRYFFKKMCLQNGIIKNPSWKRTHRWYRWHHQKPGLP